MKQNLEERIRQNTPAFDHRLPPKGHLARFEQLLAAAQTQRERQPEEEPQAGSVSAPAHPTRLRRIYIASLSAAAVVALFGLLRWGIPGGTSSVEEEVAQVAGYYDQQLRLQADELEGKLVRFDPESREAILREIRDIVARAETTDPEYAAMTPPERVTYIVRRHRIYSESLEQIGELLDQLPAATQE